MSSSVARLHSQLPGCWVQGGTSWAPYLRLGILFMDDWIHSWPRTVKSKKINVRRTSARKHVHVLYVYNCRNTQQKRRKNLLRSSATWNVHVRDSTAYGPRLTMIRQMLLLLILFCPSVAPAFVFKASVVMLPCFLSIDFPSSWHL